VDAWQAGYRDSALTRFYATLRQRLSGLPGVRNASLTDITLLSGSADVSNIVVPGAPVGAPKDAYILIIGPSFFDTMQIPILRGRDVDSSDMNTRRVLVNELFVKTNFGTENPIGRHFTLGKGRTAPELEIIGVVKDARYQSLKKDIPPTVYLPCCENIHAMTYAVRTAGDPMAITASARAVVREIDSRIPVTNITSEDRVIEQSMGQERTFATLCTAFALLAIVIASIGLYGTMGFMVARRTGEIGIRMALGAERVRVVWMMEREALILATAGLLTVFPPSTAVVRAGGVVPLRRQGAGWWHGRHRCRGSVVRRRRCLI
jgi:macrolide transport system ATP-binding/permease protein